MDLWGRLGTEPENQMNVPALGHGEKPWGRGVWSEGSWAVGAVKPQAHYVSHCPDFFLSCHQSLHSPTPSLLTSSAAQKPCLQTLMCLLEKMPNHFNNISCHLCFHRGLGSLFLRRINADCNFRQTQWKRRLQPIRFNHVWRNVILEDTRAERVDMGISYYAKRRVHTLRL